jgi:hypothetical protein
MPNNTMTIGIRYRHQVIMSVYPLAVLYGLEAGTDSVSYIISSTRSRKMVITSVYNAADKMLLISTNTPFIMLSRPRFSY